MDWDDPKCRFLCDVDRFYENIKFFIEIHTYIVVKDSLLMFKISFMFTYISVNVIPLEHKWHLNPPNTGEFEKATQ